MQPKASPGNKPSTFDKEGAPSDSAPLRGLPEGSRSEKTRRAFPFCWSYQIGRKTTSGGVSGEAELAPMAQVPALARRLWDASVAATGINPGLAAVR
jgi:hypothetical protein